MPRIDVKFVGSYDIYLEMPPTVKSLCVSLSVSNSRESLLVDMSACMNPPAAREAFPVTPVTRFSTSLSCSRRYPQLANRIASDAIAVDKIAEIERKAGQAVLRAITA